MSQHYPGLIDGCYIIHVMLPFHGKELGKSAEDNALADNGPLSREYPDILAAFLDKR